MKKTTLVASVILALTTVFSSGAFASMVLEGEKQDLKYDQTWPAVEAQIVGADYFYHQGKKIVAVSLGVTEGLPGKVLYAHLEVVFTDDDLPFGMTLASSIGKDAILWFANSNFEIEQISIGAHSQNKSAHAKRSRFSLPR